MITEIPSGGWKRNLLLTGRAIEILITLEVGPRLLRFGPRDSTANVFLAMADQLGGHGEAEWKSRGGHRLWTAPEADHSYAPDNRPVTFQPWGELGGVELIQEPDTRFGFQKRLRVEIDARDVVRVVHLLANTGDVALNICPWVLSVMAPGGTALIPQPALDLHPSEFPSDRLVQPHDFWPNRELVLWPFTNLSDGRYTFSPHFLRMKYQSGLPATKLGLPQPTGWIAYQNGALVFAKHFTRQPGATYPDRGVNLELFTNEQIFELESLAPLRPLAPGETVEHVEHWVLRPDALDLGNDDAARAFFADLPEIASSSSETRVAPDRADGTPDRPSGR